MTRSNVSPLAELSVRNLNPGPSAPGFDRCGHFRRPSFLSCMDNRLRSDLLPDLNWSVVARFSLRTCPAGTSRKGGVKLDSSVRFVVHLQLECRRIRVGSIDDSETRQ